jgi:3-hydroxyacyl-[acyl-carrier-protein] dehydratase
MSDSIATPASDSTATLASDSTATPASETVGVPSADVPAAKTMLNIVEIMAILPHRYPFLLIDRVIEIERKVRIVALKNVSANEPHFTGHFPDYPIMPGVLTIESMAQAGGALLLTEYSLAEREETMMVFTGIEEARFRRPVVPGDQLRIEVTVLNWRSRAVKMKGVCTVEGKLVADAVITCALVPRVRKPKPEQPLSPVEGQSATLDGALKS